MQNGSGITSLEIGVTDMARSLDFYRGLLGFEPIEDAPGGGSWLQAGAAALHLVEVGPAGNLGGWVGDDLQRGIRHAGYKVGDVDLQAERLRDAGVRFTLEPLDAVGGIRIAFFTDPDGTLLEILDGHLQYTRTWSEGLADRERGAAQRRPRDAPPSFDHVAVTVGDLDAALASYRDDLGYEVIGQLEQPQDPRGFVITYLQAGSAVLEVFSFKTETSPSPWTPDPDRAGHRGVGLRVDDPQRLEGLRRRGGTQLLAADGAEVLLDPDGVPLRVEHAGVRA